MPSDPSSLAAVLAAASGDTPSWMQAWGSVIAAGAAVLTLGVAGAAAAVAWGQLSESRRLRREQAQAYVVIYAQTFDRVSQHVVELVIENLGMTGARNVTITSTPPLRRTGQHGAYQEVVLPTPLPFLAPRQQWRTTWDFSPERLKDQTLPERHEVKVAYDDTFGERHEELFVLDWAVFKNRMFTSEKTVHHAAQSLADIAAALNLEQR